MYAQRKIVTVPEGGHVGLDLPSDLVGGEAEVIVLVVPRPPARPRPGSPEAVLAPEPVTEAWRAANPDKLLTAEQVDASAIPLK